MEIEKSFLLLGICLFVSFNFASAEPNLPDMTSPSIENSEVTSPHLSMFDRAGPAIQALHALFESAMRSTTMLQNRFNDLESSMFHLEQNVKKLLEWQKGTSTVTNDIQAEFKALKTDVQNINGTMSPLLNEIKAFGDSNKNVTDDLHNRIKTVERSVSDQHVVSNNVSIDLMNLQTKTNHLSDVLDDPVTSLKLVDEARFEDTIQNITSKVENASSEVNGALSKVSHMLLGEIKNLYKMASANEHRTTSNEKELGDLTDYLTTNLSKVISDLQSSFEHDLQSVEQMHNSSSEKISTRIDELETLEMKSNESIEHLKTDIKTEFEMIKDAQNKSDGMVSDMFDKLEKQMKNSSETIKNDQLKLESDIMTLQKSQNNTNAQQESLKAISDKNTKDITDLANYEKEQIVNITQFINKMDVQVYEQLAVVDNNIQNEMKKVSQVENNLHDMQDDFKKINQSISKEVSNAVKQIESKLQREINEVQHKFEAMDKSLNTTLTSLQSQMIKKQNDCNNLIGNLTRELHSVEKLTEGNFTSLQQQIDHNKQNEKVLSNNTDFILRELKGVESQINDKNKNLTQQLNSAMNHLNDSVSKVESRLQTKLNSLNGNLSQNLARIERDAKSVSSYYNDSLSHFIKNISNVEQKQISNDGRYLTMSSIIAAIGQNVTKAWNHINAIDVKNSDKLSEVVNTVSNNVTKVTTDFQNYVGKVIANQNSNIQTFLNGLSGLDKKIAALSQNYSSMVNQVYTNSLKDKVATTTCADNKMYDSGSVIQFPNNRTAYGMDQTEFLRTGIFTSQTPGLYLITTQIMSYSKGAEFEIIKNGDMLVRTQVTPYHDTDSHNYHTGTGSAVVDLDFNDKLWIRVRQAVTNMYIYGAESCITIVKMS